MNNWSLYFYGAIGGLTYSFPVYIAALKTVPPARFALAVLLFSVLVGSVFASAFVPLLGHWRPFLVTPTPHPLAVAVGLVANPIVPIFVRRAVAWAEAFNPKEPKS